MYRRLFLLLCLCLAATSVWAESVVDTIKQRGAMRVGMSTFVPWAMRDRNGDLIGFEIDVAQRLAEDMGVEVEFVPTAWDGIIPALLAGKFDLIIGGMSITPERNMTVNFTDPYASSGIHIVAHRERAAGLASLEDFNRRDVVLSVRRGATPVKVAQQRMPKATLRQFDDEALALQEVLNGNAHALLSSAPKPAFAALQHPEVLFLPVDEPFERTSEGFALRKGDADALNFFNNWIMLRSNDGWLESRHRYWFRSRDWAVNLENES